MWELHAPTLRFFPDALLVLPYHQYYIIQALVFVDSCNMGNGTCVCMVSCETEILHPGQWTGELYIIL